MANAGPDEKIMVFWTLLAQPDVVKEILSTAPPTALGRQEVDNLQSIIHHIDTFKGAAPQAPDRHPFRPPVLLEKRPVTGYQWAPIRRMRSLETPTFLRRILDVHGETLEGARAFIGINGVEYDDWMRKQEGGFNQADAFNGMVAYTNNVDTQHAQNRVVYGFSMITHFELSLKLRERLVGQEKSCPTPCKKEDKRYFTQAMKDYLISILMTKEAAAREQEVKARVNEIALWARRGQYLRMLTNEFGLGIMFFISDLVAVHDFERLMPKSGSAYNEAMVRLEQLGAREVCERQTNQLGRFVITAMMAPFNDTMDIHTEGRGHVFPGDLPPQAYSQKPAPNSNTPSSRSHLLRPNVPRTSAMSSSSHKVPEAPQYPTSYPESPKSKRSPLQTTKSAGRSQTRNTMTRPGRKKGVEEGGIAKAKRALKQSKKRPRV